MKIKLIFEGPYWSAYEWVPGFSLTLGRWRYIADSTSRNYSQTLAAATDYASHQPPIILTLPTRSNLHAV